jgi:hypothetical protein
MKRISFLLALALVCVSAVAQNGNNARMLTGINKVTTTTYPFVALDVTRLVDFNNSSAIAASMLSAQALGLTPGVIFSVHNSGAGTATITCSGCVFFSSGSGSVTLQLMPGQGADLYSDNNGLNYTVQGGIGGNGSGCSGTCVNSVFGRNGPSINATGTDYGSLTAPWQQVGNITSFFQSNTGGNLKFGNTSNFFELFNTGSALAWELQDVYLNSMGGSIASGGSTLNIAANVSTATLTLLGVPAAPVATLAVSGTGGSAALTVTPNQISSSTFFQPLITTNDPCCTQPMGITWINPIALTSQTPHLKIWCSDHVCTNLTDGDGPWDMANGTLGPNTRPDNGLPNQTVLAYGSTLTNPFLDSATLRRPTFLNEHQDLFKMFNGSLDTSCVETPATGKLATCKDPSTDAMDWSYGDAFKPGTRTIGSATAATAGTAIASGASQSLAITVSGATTGDTATCSLNAAMPATWQTGVVPLLPVVTADTVTFWLSNPSAGSITPAAATVRCTVTR